MTGLNRRRRGGLAGVRGGGSAGGGRAWRGRLDVCPAIAWQALDFRLETDGGNASRRPVGGLGHALLLADEWSEELRRVGTAHAVRDVIPSKQGAPRPPFHRCSPLVDSIAQLYSPARP